ncbi:MAG: ABC transporter substrate-binding protein [Cyanobium sp.]|nr:ABC transporter substrate-binding protein [Cyanobium sp.]
MAIGIAGCRGTTTVEMPIASWPGYEYFHLAQEKGLDRAEGLQIKGLGFPDPQDIVKAYEEGRFPIAQLTTVEAVDICSRVPDRCPVVVLILDESLGGDKVAVRPSIGSIAALRGRRVGVTPSTLGPYVLSRALATQGMDLADVRIVAMPLADMGRRLAAAEIDGAAFFPPFSDEVLASGKAVEVFTSAQIPGEIFDVLVVDPGFYRRNVPLLGRLLRVWQSAHALARRDPQAAEIMAKREGISAGAFRETEKGLVYTPLAAQAAMLTPDGQLARNLKAVLAVQKQLGLIGGETALPQVSDAPLRAAL